MASAELGSLHWIGGRLHCDGRYFDGRSLDDGLRVYLKHLVRLAAEADYDVLAHFDTVRRAAAKAFGVTRLDYAAHEEAIRGILRTLVERGKGLEVNTVTCRRGMGDLCPPLDVLRWYRELGGEILTFGSDAHTAGAIASHFGAALEMAREAGFTWVATFEQRRIRWIRI